MGQRNRRLASFTLAALAALMIGLAVLLLIGHNWQLVVAGWEGLPRILKLAAVFLVVVGSHAGAAPAVANALATRVGSSLFFACLMFGAGIWLVAQVSRSTPTGPTASGGGAGHAAGCPVPRHVGGPLPAGGSAGRLGRVGTDWVSSSRLLGPFPERGLHPVADGRPGPCMVLSQGLKLGRGPLRGPLSRWIILQAFSWGDHFWGHEEAGLYFIAVTAPLMLIVGEHHRPGHPAARALAHLRHVTDGRDPDPIEFPRFPRVLGARLRPELAAAAARLRRRAGARGHIGGRRDSGRAVAATNRRRSPPRAAVAAGRSGPPAVGPPGRLPGAVLMGFWDTIAQGEAAWGPTIVANLAMLTLAIWLMHVGLRDEQGLVFAAGVGYFLLWSVVRYVDLFAKVGGMLGAAGMFFLCGLTLFGLSVVWRHRKELHHVG